MGKSKPIMIEKDPDRSTLRVAVELNSLKTRENFIQYEKDTTNYLCIHSFKSQITKPEPLSNDLNFIMFIERPGQGVYLKHQHY